MKFSFQKRPAYGVIALFMVVAIVSAIAGFWYGLTVNVQAAPAQTPAAPTSADTTYRDLFLVDPLTSGKTWITQEFTGILGSVDNRPAVTIDDTSLIVYLDEASAKNVFYDCKGDLSDTADCAYTESATLTDLMGKRVRIQALGSDTGTYTLAFRY